MEETGQWTRVILLTPPRERAGGGGGGLPASLQAEFEKRDWFAIEQNDPFLAFTELCLRDKAQTTRSSWGLQRMEQLALVITQPHQWGDLDVLAGAVRKYVPVATIWIADDEGVRPLDGPNESASVSRLPASNSAVSSPEARLSAIDAESELQLHSIASGSSIAASFAAPGDEAFKIRPRNDDPDAAAQRITREEIDMLLQMDPEEQEHRA